MNSSHSQQFDTSGILRKSTSKESKISLASLLNPSKVQEKGSLITRQSAGKMSVPLDSFDVQDQQYRPENSFVCRNSNSLIHNYQQTQIKNPERTTFDQRQYNGSKEYEIKASRLSTRQPWIRVNPHLIQRRQNQPLPHSVWIRTSPHQTLPSTSFHKITLNYITSQPQTYQTQSIQYDQKIIQRPLYQKRYNNREELYRTFAIQDEDPKMKKTICGSWCWVLLGLLGLVAAVLGILFGFELISGAGCSSTNRRRNSNVVPKIDVTESPKPTISETPQTPMGNGTETNPTSNVSGEIGSESENLPYIPAEPVSETAAYMLPWTLDGVDQINQGLETEPKNFIDGYFVNPQLIPPVKVVFTTSPQVTTLFDNVQDAIPTIAQPWTQNGVYQINQRIEPEPKNFIDGYFVNPQLIPPVKVVFATSPQVTNLFDKVQDAIPRTEAQPRIGLQPVTIQPVLINSLN